MTEEVSKAGVSDVIVLAIVAAFPPTILALATLVVAIRNSRKVEEIHKATNSMKDALVATTEKEAHAGGVLEEKEAHARVALEERARGNQPQV